MTRAQVVPGIDKVTETGSGSVGAWAGDREMGVTAQREQFLEVGGGGASHTELCTRHVRRQTWRRGYDATSC